MSSMSDSEAGGPPEMPTEMFVVDSPYQVARWRPLANWALYLPHAIIEYGLRALAGPVFLVYWLILVFTGRLNRNLFDVLAMYERYDQRSTSFLLGFSEVYPPFDFNLGSKDNGAYPPVRVALPTPPETAPRTAALNFILAIPHYIVLVIFGIAAALAAIGGWFAVLATGAWPRSLRDFLVRVTNYYLRVWAYVVMAVSTYPRFGI